MTTGWQQLQQDLKTSPRRWLVTGAAGFIGSNLLEQLLRLDQIVIGLDNFSTGYQTNLDEVRRQVSVAQWERFNFIEGDVCDLQTCHVACTGVDIVLHQAALGSVPRSISEPITSHQSNVDGFLNILVAARDAKVKRFVYASSSSVYGDHPGLPKFENAIGEQLSPYAVNKYINELYAGVFYKRYGFETIGLRYFNVFGPRQDPSGAYAAVIPCFTRALFDQEQAVIYGDGETSRDFCFVDNVVQVNLLAGCTTNVEAVNQVYNVAVGERLSLNELYKFLASAYQELKGRDPGQPAYKDFRDGDVRHSLADISKAQRLLEYQPTHRAQEAFPRYVEWYLKERA